MENPIPYTRDMQELAFSFDCGNPSINSFLRSDRAFDTSYGKTYVYMSTDGKTIIGYINISAGYIAQREGDLFFRQGGSIHINDFAIDRKFRGVMVEDAYGAQNKVSHIVFDAFIQLIRDIQENYVGVAFITLSSTEEGYHFYEDYAFEELDDEFSFACDAGEVKCTQMYYALNDK